MSKLPKAPLVEVVFELRWDISSQNDLVDFQYLHGDLYSAIKEQFPIRENLTPLDIPFEVLKNVPVFRYRTAPNSYPLIQVGPGLITFNTIDEHYVWEDFRDRINLLLDIINSVYSKFKTLSIKPSLIYIDFIKFDKNHSDTVSFINENLNINISSNILPEYNDKKSDEVNLTFNYTVNTDVLSISIGNGKLHNENDVPGLVLQIRINESVTNNSTNDLKEWLDKAHELSSNTFKSIIKEQFYNTFK